jgi:formylglycine-generating enzyme required for sulfatase activity
MKYTALLAALAALLIAKQSATAQGSLTPPGAPATTQKSLQEIWNKIEEISLGLPKTVPQLSGFVTVGGGTLPQGTQFAGQKVSTFYIGITEVTWSEWQNVREWAVSNGYSDLANIGSGLSGNHPVVDISWYDAVKWCNAKSEMEGLTPVYSYNGTILKVGDWQILGAEATDNIVMNIFANGYRLPTAVEWVGAAVGGVSGGNFTYSGSNDLNSVAWFASNSGNSTKTVATKNPNQLGLYDMNGNAMEWCWNRIGIGRITFGGTWDSSDVDCALASYSTQNALPQSKNFFDERGDYGLRLVRSY